MTLNSMKVYEATSPLAVLRPTSNLALVFTSIFILYNFLVTVMYETIVVSLLMGRGEPTGVEVIGDLLKPEFSDVRIYLRSNGFELDFLKSHPQFELIEAKIDYFDTILQKRPDLAQEVLSRVMSGTYVLLAATQNFQHAVCQV